MKKTLISHVFGFLLFIIPFSIQMIIWDNSAFLSGKLNIWSAFFLNVQDIFILFIILYSLFLLQKNKILSFPQIPYEILGFLFLCLILSIFVKDEILNLLSCIHFFIIIFCFSFLQIFKIKLDIICRYFLASMLIVSIIAFIQFILQHSLGLNFIGEPMISKDILGVAKIDIDKSKIVRAYGTFLHPNILAFFSILAFYIADKINYKTLRWFFIIPLIISFSRAAILVFLISLILFRKKIFWKEFLFIFSIVSIFIYNFYEAVIIRLTAFDSSLHERIQGIISSIKMLLKNPFGVGVKHYTIYLQDFTSNIIMPWEFQPVHNFYLLVANEVGVIGLLLLLVFFVKVWRNCEQWQKPILFSILFLGFFDHYLWTSYNAMLIFWFLCFLFYFEKKSY